MPIAAWGSNFNFSIWYLEFRGDDSADGVRPILEASNDFKERQAMKICLKHLRQRNLMGTFQSLRESTGNRLQAH